MMTPFESAVRGSLEGSHGGRVLVRDDHGATALHHYRGLNSATGPLDIPQTACGCDSGVYPTVQKCHETAGFDPAGRVSLRRRRCHAGWCSNWQMRLVEVPPVRAAVSVSRWGASWYCSAGGLSWLSWSLVQVVPPGVFGPLWTRDVDVWVWAGWGLDDGFNLRLRRGEPAQV